MVKSNRFVCNLFAESKSVKRRLPRKCKILLLFAKQLDDRIVTNRMALSDDDATRAEANTKRLLDRAE
jgi:hypothetical protein